MSSAAQSTEGVSPRAVDLTAIEREIKQFWRDNELLTRACMSNLIVYCPHPDSARGRQDDLAEVVRLHPSRVLLLVAQAQTPAGAVEAYVSAQCSRAGAGRQVCSEHIRLEAGSGAEVSLPPLARSLIIGDLPTALWWSAAEPPFESAVFGELRGLSAQILYDSSGWKQPLAGLAAAARWAGADCRAHVLSDLAWRRLEPWRRLLCQALDPSAAPGALGSISEVAVDHAPAATSGSLLLIAWLAERLRWRIASRPSPSAAELAWDFQTERGTTVRAISRPVEREEWGIDRVVLHCDCGPTARTTTVQRTSAGRLSIDKSDIGKHGVATPRLSLSNLVVQELALRCDAVFLDSLQMAGRMLDGVSQ